jgi:hypothetical protein
MVQIYRCYPCQIGDHQHCAKVKTVPAGQFGGSSCICGCKGDPYWGLQDLRFSELPQMAVFPPQLPRSDELTGSD